MKKAYKKLGIVVLLLGLLTGLNLLIPRPGEEHSITEGALTSVFIVDHGYHTGIVVPGNVDSGPDWGNKLAYTTPAEWYEFGWGDREYYRDPAPSLGVTARALLKPTPATLHVCAINIDPVLWAGSSRWVELQLSPRQLEAIASHILDTFVQDEAGFVWLGKGNYGNSAFYEANFNYHLFKNCNSWTAKGIRSMGYSSSWLTVSPSGVFRFLED